MQALIDACASARVPDARILRVFSNRKAAYGLTRAANANPPIPTDYLALQPYLKANTDRSRVDYDLEVARKLLTATTGAGDDIDLIVLAGWMHVFSAEFLDVLSGVRPFDAETGRMVGRQIPIINLHPALPGAFDGSRAIERAFEAYRKGEIDHTGVMVHRVIKEVDQGEPILVREVEIMSEDDLPALEQRIHSVEHDLLVESVTQVLTEPKSS